MAPAVLQHPEAWTTDERSHRGRNQSSVRACRALITQAAGMLALAQVEVSISDASRQVQ
jgi:hypothetical protein